MIHREGYGNAFNIMYIKDNSLYKYPKNEYGRIKLMKERAFYSICSEKEVDFPFAKVDLSKSEGIQITYYDKHCPLYTFYWKASAEKQECMRIHIECFLKKLHSSSKIVVPLDIIKRDLYEETYTKVLTRYEEIKDCLNDYEIDSVNSVPLLSFNDLMVYLQKKIIEYIDSLPQEYSLIHGDCQFSNILYEEKTDSYIFIDPRGYFGKTDLYGLPQYDSAKLLFALTGYDIFDSTPTGTLQIEKKNLLIDWIPIDKSIFEKKSLELYIMATIWLANAHCFKENTEKAALSHYYARYIGSLIYMSDISLTK